MKLKFWGAARTVTGSHHIVECMGKRIALDCGLFQGHRADMDVLNREFPAPPSTLSAVVLSHAHIDHAGNIPNLVKQGFTGSIYCTAPTADLSRIMLLDSGFIQERDVEFVNKRRKRRGETPVLPLYTAKDAEACFGQLVEVPLHHEFAVAPGFRARFLHAGHILGSAVTRLEITEKDRVHALAFTGDIGRENMEILPDFEAPADVDTLICESTYGNRKHEPPEDLKNKLLEVLTRTFDRGGRVIIPAFSVGRTQEIVYRLNQLWNEGRLPRVPIYVDSPLSARATEVFRKHAAFYNRRAHEESTSGDLFGFETLEYISDHEASKALNFRHEPMVIISASGMAENGRIRHHLANNITNPKNTILIVGFMAENTLGRMLVERRPIVRIFGEEFHVKAEVKVLNGFSAHADEDELRDFIFKTRTRSGGKLKRVFLVHGEEEPMSSLAGWVRDTMGLECHMPNRGDEFEL